MPVRSGPVVLMMLDSLADTYIKRGDTPYLASRLPDGRYADIESLFAFEGIMAAVMTGKWPDETGVFARFAYGPSKSVMRHNPLRAMMLIDRHAYYADGERRDGRQNFPLIKAVRKALKKWWITGGFNNLTPYGRIPLALSTQFRYSMILGAYDHTLELGGHETFFGRCRRQGQKCLFHYGTLPSARKRLEEIPDLAEYGIVFVHTWSHLDTRGHDFGPESDDLRRMTRDCDQELSEFLPWMEHKLPEASFILFADHGMHPVHTAIDVSPIVERAIDGSGPIVFVDSTAVRAWGAARDLAELGDRLDGIQGVSVLTGDDLKARHAWFPDGEYGRLFAVAEPGYVFTPDFFVGWEPRKGMHGYYQDTSWLRPSLFWYGQAFDGLPAGFNPENMTDVWRLADHALSQCAGGT